jgi:hypothetical protein
VGAALVGSHARGEARPDSDVDLMIITTEPQRYVEDDSWVGVFGCVETVTVERWGAVTSLRVHYEGGPEVELGITTPEWASTDPVDPGTERVVRDGIRPLLDRAGMLAGLDATMRRRIGDKPE